VQVQQTHHSCVTGLSQDSTFCFKLSGSYTHLVINSAAAQHLSYVMEVAGAVTES